MAAASCWAVLAVAAYFAAFFPAPVREQSRFIADKFGGAYDEWARAVPAFQPRLTEMARR